ncbi:hypothetical protein [Vulgatibacter sp.]|uniref:hypothetical protein n=1 Tax=Vulgatibacter sp. TaxID=1971226 RepID=UPI003561D626
MSKRLAMLVAVVALGAVACGGSGDGDSEGGLNNGGSGGGGGGECPTDVNAACIDSGATGNPVGPCAEEKDAYYDCIGEPCGAQTEPALIACIESECPAALPCWQQE